VNNMEIAYEEAQAPYDETAEGTTLDNLIARGLVAKVGFASEQVNSEWMWIHVLEQKPDGSLAGVLLNTPAYVATVSYGDEVDGFRRDHIYEALIDPEAAMYSTAARAARN